MSRRYEISHVTTYTYDDDVSDSFGLAYCRPRDGGGQLVVEHELWTDPGHADLGGHTDAQGNQATYFHVTEPHRTLRVGARSVVDCGLEEPDPARAGVRWEDARPLGRGDLPEAALVAEVTMPSPLVDLGPEVREYAARSLTPGRPLVEAVLDLVRRIHDEFDYDPEATTVSTRVPEVLRLRGGVCQDFAHVAIAGLRSHGLAARYVSGYLATDPPPGTPRLVGADATHAWLQCWVPGHGWLSVDPTNDTETGDRHIAVAWGRDYADVPPVKGVIFTEATESTMAVEVDVVPVADDQRDEPRGGQPSTP